MPLVAILSGAAIAIAGGNSTLSTALITGGLGLSTPVGAVVRRRREEAAPVVREPSRPAPAEVPKGYGAGGQYRGTDDD